jgi:hypothetical protein
MVKIFCQIGVGQVCVAIENPRSKRHPDSNEKSPKRNIKNIPPAI